MDITFALQPFRKEHAFTVITPEIRLRNTRMERCWNGEDVALYDLPRRLDDDVIRIILSCSDVQTVVAFSQTSKHSHDLVFFTKDIWLAISWQLQIRGYIDLTPDQRIEQFSIDQLIFLIKRIAVASTDVERILPAQTISFTIRNTDTRLVPDTLAYLTPGSEYLLLCKTYLPGEKIACWSMKTRSVVWDSRDVRLELSGDDIRIVKFTAQVGKPDQLEILVCLRESYTQHPYEYDITYVVQLWYVDVRKKSAETVRLLSCEPELGTSTYQEDCRLQINGDHLVARCLNRFVVHSKISGNSMQFYVGDDKLYGYGGEYGYEEEYCDGEGDEDVVAEINTLYIFKGTLIVGRPQPMKEQYEILIWDLTALEAQHCYQVTRKCFKIEEVTTLQKFKISVGSGSTRLQCYPSPFNHETCLFYIRTTLYTPTGSIQETFQKYLISRPAAHTVSIKSLGKQEFFWDGRRPLGLEDRSFCCVKEGTYVDDYPVKATYHFAQHEAIAYRNPYSRTIVYVNDRKVNVLYQG